MSSGNVDRVVVAVEDEGSDDTEVRARGVHATVTASTGRVLHVASVHTLNAAGGGAATVAKMRHYRSLRAFVTTAAQPLVIGMDANAWYDRIDPQAVDHTHEHTEHALFDHAAAAHGLRDVQVEHLVRIQPDLLERRRRRLGAEADDGALEVTYQRARNTHPKVNRMDRILASEVLRATDVRTLYGDSLTVGSDHAMVVADLVGAAGRV